MAAFDITKFRRELERETQKASATVLRSITRSDKIKIGSGVIDEMRSLIAKGISPIASKGRFAAYKWAGAVNTASKLAKRLTKSRRKAVRQKLASLKNSKYPYSVKKDFPSKRERPVNLFLSGDFLFSLIATPTERGVNIGFDSKLSELKESGHREGVNGQPSRPILPIGREEFAPTIYRRVLDVVRTIVQQKFKT